MKIKFNKNTFKIMFVFFLISIAGFVFFAESSVLSSEKSLFDTAFNLANIDQPPKILSASMPRYPFTAKKEGIEGRVVLKLVVDSNGNAQEPVVVKSEPEGVFDKAALESISNYRFKPAVKNGKNVACIVRLPIKFVIQADNTLDLSNAYKMDEVDQPPTVLETELPVYPSSAREDGVEGFVVLQFVVGADGYAYDPVITNSVPGNVFDNAAMDALYDYRFKPAVKDGNDVDCIMTLTIKFSFDE